MQINQNNLLSVLCIASIVKARAAKVDATPKLQAIAWAAGSDTVSNSEQLAVVSNLLTGLKVRTFTCIGIVQDCIATNHNNQPQARIVDEKGEMNIVPVANIMEIMETEANNDGGAVSYETALVANKFNVKLMVNGIPHRNCFQYGFATRAVAESVARELNAAYKLGKGL